MDRIAATGPVLTPLRRISNPKGDVFHAMKATDSGFAGFGEAYFTTVLSGDTKGWKKHLHMCINLVVPVGSVEIHVHDDLTGVTTNYLLGPDTYCRLTVPPGFWVAFTGRSEGLNLMLNLASIAHDPDEAVSVPLSTYSLSTSA